VVRLVLRTELVVLRIELVVLRIELVVLRIELVEVLVVAAVVLGMLGIRPEHCEYLAAFRTEVRQRRLN